MILELKDTKVFIIDKTLGYQGDNLVNTIQVTVDKEALKRAYHAYHDLRGNDVATRLYNEVMELPTEVRE